jgi:hypothetical protein
VRQIPANEHAIAAIRLTRRKLAARLKRDNDQIGISVPYDLMGVRRAGPGLQKRKLELRHGADQAIAVIAQ